MSKIKRILDSVHGTIFVEKEFFNLIDTPAFQRLRRVEQTSTRSIFPSARHDRFVHSLGVFHIGSEIVGHLKNETKKLDIYNEEEFKLIFKAYKVACLLHDVGHSPFSHTFEKYFGEKEELCEQLATELNRDSFSVDVWEVIEKAKNNKNILPKEHECTSAILCCRDVLKSHIKRISRVEDGSFLEMVVRMITGIKYTTDTGIDSIRNCFIDLLHGEVDADRIDYACRDTWAAGYSTTKVDARSLVSCIHISKKPDNSNAFCVCFDKRALAEIENMFGVKNFQKRHVFCHHTVVYEQYLFEKAVIEMAKRKYGGSDKEAMHKIFSVDSLTENKDREFHFLCDDDIIHLLKADSNNVYYKEWNSHKYVKIPLWKSVEEFLQLFPMAKGKLHEIKDFDKRMAESINEILKGYTFSKIDDEYEKIYVKENKIDINNDLSHIKVLINNHVVNYDMIEPIGESSPTKELYFYYVYIALPQNDRDGNIIPVSQFRAQMQSQMEQIIKKIYE